jgi:hypothetical protein
MCMAFTTGNGDSNVYSLSRKVRRSSDSASCSILDWWMFSTSPSGRTMELRLLTDRAMDSKFCPAPMPFANSISSRMSWTMSSPASWQLSSMMQISPSLLPFWAEPCSWKKLEVSRLPRGCLSLISRYVKVLWHRLFWPRHD